jgi:hypothetical protein
MSKTYEVIGYFRDYDPLVSEVVERNEILKRRVMNVLNLMRQYLETRENLVSPIQGKVPYENVIYLVVFSI